MWHGAFENDGFRRAWLTEVGDGGRVAAGGRPRTRPAYQGRRETMIDTLADAVDEHLDLDLLLAGTRVGRPAPMTRPTVAGDRHRQR